ncbi:unnamed protein product, partial [Candidula unifasciata]
MAYRSISILKQGRLLQASLSKGCLCQTLSHRWYTATSLSSLARSDHLLRHLTCLQYQHRLYSDKPSKPDPPSQSKDQKSPKNSSSDDKWMKIKVKIGDYEYNNSDGKGGKTSGSGGAPDKQMLFFAALGGAALLYMFYASRYKEITMKEFFHTYLPTGS